MFLSFYVPQYAKFVRRTNVVLLDVVMYNAYGLGEKGTHSGGGREITICEIPCGLIAKSLANSGYNIDNIDRMNMIASEPGPSPVNGIAEELVPSVTQRTRSEGLTNS